MKKYHSFSSREFFDDEKVQESIGTRGLRVMELASLDVKVIKGLYPSKVFLMWEDSRSYPDPVKYWGHCASNWYLIF